MNKTKRFLIVLLAIGVAVAFLFPTFQWYALTKEEDKALATSSREQIRDYSRRIALKVVTELRDMVKAGDTKPVGEAYAYVIELSKIGYRDLGIAVPAVWDAKAILSGFETERGAYDALENYLSKRILDLKSLHGRAIQLGLDLSGGMSVVIKADLEALAAKLGHPLSDAERTAAMEQAIETLNSRIDKFGLTEPSIRQIGENGVSVEIPGTADPERINSIVLGRGRLAFHIVDDAATQALTEYLRSNPLGVTGDSDSTLVAADPAIVPAGSMIRKYYTKDKYGLDQWTSRYIVISAEPGMDGTHVVSANVSRDAITNNPETTFALDDEGVDTFYKLTSANVGKSLAVVLDDRVKAYAVIQEPIKGNVRISGFSEDEAKALALVLRTAALPVELIIESQQSIGASLGDDAILQGEKAVALGLVLVLIFMFIYYKGAGVNATVAQALNIFINLGVLSAFNLTLTLPAIAGFILNVGMAIDANVIIFERIKEELRLGKGRRASIEAGFDKAFWAVVDSNITTIIAALFMAQLGTGPIQGFAVTLAIGNITSLFTSLFVSKLIFDFGTDQLGSKSVSISWRVK